MKIFDTRIFLEHRRFLLQSFPFRSSKTETFRRNRYAPHLCMKNFDTKIFLKHRRVSLRILSALKQNSTENSDILFLCIKVFRYIKFSDSLKHGWVTLRSYSVRSCETKFSTKPLPPPPLSLLTHKLLIHTRNFPHEVFRHCEPTRIRRKT